MDTTASVFYAGRSKGMPRPLTGQEREAFLAEPHVAVISLPADDGRPPLAFPGWYAFLGGDRITHYTQRTEPRSRKLRLLREGSVLSLCVQRADPPYRYVTVEGTVLDENGAPTAEQRLAIIGRYLAEGEARAYLDDEIASGVAVSVFTIRADRWTGFDFAEDGG